LSVVGDSRSFASAPLLDHTARRVICPRRAAVHTSMRKLLLVALVVIGVAGAAPGAASARGVDSNEVAVEGIKLCHEGFEIQ
jgi:hypothetical protein